MDFLIPEIGLLEKIIRCAVVYFFLLIAVRSSGKRQLGQMTTFDLILVLILSELVQNAMVGSDNSLTGGLIGVAIMLGLNAGVGWITHRHPGLERLVEHEPTILVRHGRVLWPNVRREHMSPADFRSALRQEGVISLRDIRFVVLEPDGRLSVIRRQPPASEPATDPRPT